jgi:hypothetical protein
MHAFRGTGGRGKQRMRAGAKTDAEKHEFLKKLLRTWHNLGTLAGCAYERARATERNELRNGTERILGNVYVTSTHAHAYACA